MSLEERKVEASRRRWSRIPNPRAIFKPLKMIVYNIEKAEVEDTIGIKLREEFGAVEEFVKNANAKHLYHDVNHDYFSVVEPRHTPIHLLRHHINSRPQNRPIDATSSNRRSLHDSQHARKLPPINHQRTSLSGDAQNPVAYSEVRGKLTEIKKSQPDIMNETWRNTFSYSTQAEVDHKVAKCSEEISVPGMMSPMSQRVSPPAPKVMTKLQQIELSENPLDFSVSEDELNPDGDDFDNSDSHSGGFVDYAKESDCACDGKEYNTKFTPTIPASELYDHLSPGRKPSANKTSLEDGEIDENEFKKGLGRSSSKVRHEDLAGQLPSDGTLRNDRINVFCEGNLQKSKIHGDECNNVIVVENFNEKHGGKDEVDLEEGEIEDDRKGKQSVHSSLSSSSSDSSSSHSLSDESSDASEFSPSHSKHATDNDSNIECHVNSNVRRDNIIKNMNEDAKENTIVSQNQTPKEPLDTQDQIFSQKISKLSAFEALTKKSVNANLRTSSEPAKEKARGELVAFSSKAKFEEQQESPMRAPTPALNAVTKKPKQEKSTKTSKNEAKDFNSKMKNENGIYKTNDESKVKADIKHSETIIKPLDKLRDDKRDQKCDAKGNKKQPEQRFIESANNQRGISFVSAIQSSNSGRKKTAPSRESALKEKKVSKVDVKSNKRKSDEGEKDNLEKQSEVPLKKQKTESNQKVGDAPLILRFNNNMFAKLEKTEKKRKNEEEVQHVSKKLKTELDVNTKDASNDNLKKKVTKKQAGTEKTSDQDLGLSTKQYKKTKYSADIIESPSITGDVDKKQKMHELAKKDSELHISQNKKSSKISSKMGIKKDGCKTDSSSKLSHEEIFKKTNELLSKGIFKDKNKLNNKKTIETEQNLVNGQHLLVPKKDDALSSKSNSPKEKEKKESLKNSAKHGSGASKVDQQIFRGMFRMATELSHESCLTDDMKEKQARSSDAPNKNQSHVESIRRVAEHHLNKSQLAHKMAEVIQAENGGRTNFRSLLNLIDSHVHSFLGTAELSKFTEGCFNVRHHDQLIDNMEASIKDLGGTAERNRLTFLLQSFRVAANRHHYFQMFNKDKDVNEAALKQIRLTDPKNSPRSSPDSTCTNPCTIVHQVPNQQSAGGVDTSALKNLNQPQANYLNMWSSIHIFMTSMDTLSKLASDPSCQDLFDKKSSPGDLVLIHKDLQTWTKWFEDVVTRIGALHHLG